MEAAIKSSNNVSHDLVSVRHHLLLDSILDMKFAAVKQMAFPSLLGTHYNAEKD